MNPLAEFFHGNAESTFSFFKPFVRGLSGKTECGTQCGLDIVLVKVKAIAFIDPVQSRPRLEGRFELFVNAFLRKVPFHVSDVWVVAAVTLILVEDTQEHIENWIATVVAACLAVDVEQHHIGRV